MFSLNGPRPDFNRGDFALNLGETIWARHPSSLETLVPRPVPFALAQQQQHLTNCVARDLLKGRVLRKKKKKHESSQEDFLGNCLIGLPFFFLKLNHIFHYFLFNDRILASR